MWKYIGYFYSPVTGETKLAQFLCASCVFSFCLFCLWDLFIFILCVRILFCLYMCVFTVLGDCWGPEEGIRSPAPGVTDSCELPSGFWELNMGPLWDQDMLPTTEPFLQPSLCFSRQDLSLARNSPSSRGWLSMNPRDQWSLPWAVGLQTCITMTT